MNLFKFYLAFLFFVILLLSSLVKSDVKQMTFEKRKLKLDSKIISVEIADTEEKAERGLMYRKHLNENEGMLFVFKDERPRSFWMKNTFVDLDIGFFSKEQILVEIHQMTASKSELTIHPDSCDTKKPAQFALEMSRGWFAKHNIKVGTKFNFSAKK